LLLICHGVIAGLRPLANPSPTVARVLSDPILESLRIDFDRELRTCLRALFAGARLTHHTEPSP
jgi:hypothetical protein